MARKHYMDDDRLIDNLDPNDMDDYDIDDDMDDEDDVDYDDMNEDNSDDDNDVDDDDIDYDDDDSEDREIDNNVHINEQHEQQPIFQNRAIEEETQYVPDQEGLIDNLHITLVAEAGQIQLSLKDIQQLKPNQVFSIAELPPKVKLIANGILIGDGFLVELNGRLGVKISTLNCNKNATV